MINRKCDISVVIPVFNERNSLVSLVDRLLPVLNMIGSNEVIFVDDGSNDGTDEVIDSLQRKYAETIKSIHLRANCGKSMALQYGFSKAQGELVAMMDADLQDRPEEIPVLVKYLKDNNLDVVTGWKHTRRDPVSKKILSRVFNYVVRRFSGLKIHDFNCGLKLMRKECLRDLKLYGSLHRFIIVLLAEQGFKVGEFKVEHDPRKFGSSKYNARRIYEGLLDFFTIFFITRYMQSPLYFFGFYGILCFIASFLCGIFFFGLHLVSLFTYYPQGRLSEHPLWVFSPIMFLIGMIFIFFGLIGELMYYLFSTQKLHEGYVRRYSGFLENDK